MQYWGCISLLLFRLPKLPGPLEQHLLGNLDNLASNEDKQLKAIIYPHTSNLHRLSLIIQCIQSWNGVDEGIMAWLSIHNYTQSLSLLHFLLSNCLCIQFKLNSWYDIFTIISPIFTVPAWAFSLIVKSYFIIVISCTVKCIFIVSVGEKKIIFKGTCVLRTAWITTCIRMYPPSGKSTKIDFAIKTYPFRWAQTSIPFIISLLH